MESVISYIIVNIIGLIKKLFCRPLSTKLSVLYKTRHTVSSIYKAVFKRHKYMAGSIIRCELILGIEQWGFILSDVIGNCNHALLKLY